MARPHKVWYRKQTDWWMVKIGGKQIKLAKGKDQRAGASSRFHELMAATARAPESAAARTADLVEAYLRHSRIHLAADTHRINKYYCQLLAEACGTIPVRDIRAFHIARWVDRKIEAKEWGDTTVYNARRTAFRVFSWAKGQGMIISNPLAGLSRPKPAPRQRALSDAEFQQLYAHAGSPLRDLLLALYLTGARPKEVRELRWRQVKDGRWVLGKHKTFKHTGKLRVIHLNSAMREMMTRLKGTARGEYVFLNTRDEPWTMTALRQQVWRLKKKLGLAEDVCSYLCRHGFGTRAILNGVDAPTVMELMGHTSMEMISKVYVHLADQHQHLADAVEKVNASAMPLPTGYHSTRKRAKPVAKLAAG